MHNCMFRFLRANNELTMKINSKYNRLISSKRSRKIRKRGDFVWFDMKLQSYCWIMKPKNIIEDN